MIQTRADARIWLDDGSRKLWTFFSAREETPQRLLIFEHAPTLCNTYTVLSPFLALCHLDRGKAFEHQNRCRRTACFFYPPTPGQLPFPCLCLIA